MAIHFRPAPLLAMIGVLALGGASAARAQDTSAAVRADTSGYQPYQDRTDLAPSGMSAADSVVCKDGSNEGNRGGVSCGGHGGIDSVVTTATMKARGWLGKSDSSAATDTSSSSQKQSP